MFRLISVRKMCAAATLVVAGLGGSAAMACPTDTYFPRVAYEPAVRAQWVVSYVTREVPYTVAVPRYDDCGHVHLVERTAIRTVVVPVKRLVYLED